MHFSIPQKVQSLKTYRKANSYRFMYNKLYDVIIWKMSHVKGWKKNSWKKSNILFNEQHPFVLMLSSLIHMTSSLVWQPQCIRQIIHKCLTILFLVHMLLGLSPQTLLLYATPGTPFRHKYIRLPLWDWGKNWVHTALYSKFVGCI